MARSETDRVREQMWGNMWQTARQQEAAGLPEDVDYQEFHDSQTPSGMDECGDLPPGIHVTTAKAEQKFEQYS